MSAVDKERLIQARLEQDDVEIPGVGVVRVRALSRDEALSAQALRTPILVERRALQLGVVDPPLSEDEVRRWQAGSPAGEIEPVAERIRQLSGMTDGSAKAAYKSVHRPKP